MSVSIDGDFAPLAKLPCRYSNFRGFQCKKRSYREKKERSDCEVHFYYDGGCVCQCSRTALRLAVGGCETAAADSSSVKVLEDEVIKGGTKQSLNSYMTVELTYQRYHKLTDVTRHTTDDLRCCIDYEVLLSIAFMFIHSWTGLRMRFCTLYDTSTLRNTDCRGYKYHGNSH